MSIFNEHSIGVIASVVAMLSALAALIKSFFFSPKEARKIEAETNETEANTAVQYEEALARANTRSEIIERRMTVLEDKVTKRDAMIAELTERASVRDKTIMELTRRIAERDRQIEDLKAWAEALVKQVRDLGGTPVDFTRRNGRAG